MSLIPTHILETAGRSPDAAALRAGKRTITYGEMSAAMNFLAERLIVEGVRTGERVVILLNDDLDRILATLGVVRSGGIAVPLPAHIEFSSIDAIARQCEPFCVVTTREHLLRYPLLRDKLSCQFVFLDELGSHNPNTGVNGGGKPDAGTVSGDDRIPALMNLAESDGTLLMYGDSEARRKGMLFTHLSLFQELRIMRDADPDGGSRQELMLHPVTEVLGITRILHLITAGGTVCLPSSKRLIEEIGQDIAEYHCTAISVGARTIADDLDLLADRVSTLGSTIEHVEICGSSLSREQKAKLLEIFPAAGVVGFYGTSEAPRSAVLQFRTEPDKLESSGRPASGVEIFIRNGGKKPARTGQAGEVEIRGGHTMSRFWDDQQRAPQREKDCLRNGDVGYLDKEGYLHILGGAEDLIHVAGGVISPFEVETRIRAMYPECEICVLGIPDPLDSGNEIAVLCYTTPGNRTIILSELSRALSDQIEKNKIPKVVYRIERFPHTGEMIHRKELRRRILEGVTMDETP